MSFLNFALRGLFLLIFSSSAFAQSPGPLNGKFFGDGNQALVVVLHGNLYGGGPADYHYGFAKRIADQNAGATVFAMLRPGYYDGRGLKSKGSTNGRRDNFSRQNNRLVAETIQRIASALDVKKVIGVGHSGGAAQLGAIIGTHPGLLDSVVLVSCPCNISQWRAMQGRSPWKRSQSPSRYVNKVSLTTAVTTVVGSEDSNTRPVISEQYVGKLRARGLRAKSILVPGGDHGFYSLQRTVERVVKTETR